MHIPPKSGKAIKFSKVPTNYFIKPIQYFRSSKLWPETYVNRYTSQ